ncbi:MAG: cytochrome C oxidase subunit IV family protein [Candidatus Bipolaricaulia bacterium]
MIELAILTVLFIATVLVLGGLAYGVLRHDLSLGIRRAQAAAPPGPEGELSHGERAHPTVMTYIQVAVVLAVVTLAEVGIFYADPLREALIPIFLVLSAAKFGLVAMFYMHLRFDSRLFSGFFVGGLLIAVSIIVALMALFQVFVREPRSETVAAVAVEEEEQVEVGSEPAAIERGRQLAQQNACLGCHTTTGEVIIGPTWKELFGSERMLDSGETITADEAYLRESILNPNAKVVQGFNPIMPTTFGNLFSAEDIDAIVAYIKSLKEE